MCGRGALQRDSMIGVIDPSCHVTMRSYAVCGFYPDDHRQREILEDLYFSAYHAMTLYGDHHSPAKKPAGPTPPS